MYFLLAARRVTALDSRDGSHSSPGWSEAGLVRPASESEGPAGSTSSEQDTRKKESGEKPFCCISSLANRQGFFSSALSQSSPASFALFI